MPILFSRVDHRTQRWANCECQLCNPKEDATMMVEYKVGDYFSMREPEPLLYEPGSRVSWRVTTGFCMQVFHGTVKKYSLGRSLVLFDGDFLKWVRPEYLTLEEK